jgi:hypothetical protein
MRQSGASFASPKQAATYLVLDELKHGRFFRETDETQADRERLIQDIVSGRYKKPVRVIAFNTAEGWARDVTHDLAREIVYTTGPLSESARDFVERVSDLLPTGLQRGLTHSLNRTESSVPLFTWF